MLRSPSVADAGTSVPICLVRPALALATAALLLGAPGCGSSESEDEHHMEHFVPAHKPASFKGAVDQLQARTSHLKHHVGDSGEIVQRELTELADIIGWIPELAADSDLNEADWTQADSVSRKMLAVYSQTATSGLESLLADLPPLIESLQPLVPRAGRPEPSMRHDHDHHDHHDHHHDDHQRHGEHGPADGDHTDEPDDQSDQDSHSESDPPNGE